MALQWNAWPAITSESIESTATRSFERLWTATHRSACPEELSSLVSSVFVPWGGAAIDETPAWPSDIGDDHSPYEFSLALTPDAAELRLLVEAQGSTGEFESTREACLRLNSRLAERGADLQRFEQIRDLLLPNVRHARFSLWHAITLAPGRLRAKAYLNPQIQGAAQATQVTAAALRRLGIGASWSRIAAKIPSHYLSSDAVRYFALDLEKSATARVKVYVYLRDATAEALESIAAFGPKYVMGQVTEFCRAMIGPNRLYNVWPICVYIAFTEKNAKPSGITVQIPIRFYVPNDTIAHNRIRSYLKLRGIDSNTYDRALQAVARRPLSTKSGLHSYVSLRTGRGTPRVTVYFGVELYQRASLPSVRPIAVQADGGRRLRIRGC